MITIKIKKSLVGLSSLVAAIISVVFIYQLAYIVNTNIAYGIVGTYGLIGAPWLFCSLADKLIDKYVLEEMELKGLA